MKRWIVGTIAAVMFFVSVPVKETVQAESKSPSLTFVDSRKAPWAVHSIGKVKHQGIMNGYKDGTFRPEQTITRLEAIVAAIRLMGLEKEALARPKDEKLPFRDADIIETKYKWAKGYVALAAERKVILPTEKKLNPGGEAPRAWVTMLLMRSLDLGFLAYERRTIVPPYKDAEDVPKETYGYIDVAIQYNIVSGYPDGTFQPNRSITRAEMSVLLDRTLNLKFEREGAITVVGSIQSISEEELGSRKLMIQSLGQQKEFTVTLSESMAITNRDAFIPTAKIKAGDLVMLQLGKDQQGRASFIHQASVLEEESLDMELSSVTGFTLKIERRDKGKFSMTYKLENGSYRASVESVLKGKWENKTGDEAVKSIRKLLKEAKIKTREDFVNYDGDILPFMTIKIGMIPSDVLKIDVEYRLSNGEVVSTGRFN